MVFSGYAHTEKSPFHTVLIHGLVRDAQGRKMSKSLGNGIDPLEIIEEYGADALRLTLLIGNALDNDMRFHIEKIESSRNFANKIWNASRFILMNLQEVEITQPSLEELETADKWILSKVNTLAKDVTENMDKYEMGIAVQKIYDFIWDEFCDWYIEMVKPRLWKKEEDTDSANKAFWTLRTVLAEALKLLHPFMPFITEEIFLTLLPQIETIMLAAWPEYSEDRSFPQEESMIEKVKELVRGVRNLRAEMNVPPSKKVSMILMAEDEKTAQGFEDLVSTYSNLLGAQEVIVGDNSKPNVSVVTDTAVNHGKTVTVVTSSATAFIPLAELVDYEKEKARLEKEKARLEKEISRAENMLANENFTSKAPAEKIQAEKDKLQTYQQMMEQILENLDRVKV
jgi:valyl-tRNA synthetase